MTNDHFRATLTTRMRLAWSRSIPISSPGTWTVYGYTVVWLLGVVVPLVGVLFFSFLATRGIRFLFEPTLEAYIYVVTTGRYEVALRSLRIMATVTFIELLIGFPFALWLAKGLKSNWVKMATFTLMSVPFFLSPPARTIVWRVVLGRHGPINTVLIGLGLIDEPLDWLLFSEFAVHFAFVGPYFPTMVWPCFLAISLIDDELLEASKDLGASSWHTLRHIIIPLSMPGVVAGVVFTFVPMLGDNVVPKLIGGGQVWLLGGSMYNLITAMNYGVAAAMSAIVLILMGILQVVLWLVFRRLGGVSEIFEVLRR